MMKGVQLSKNKKKKLPRWRESNTATLKYQYNQYNQNNQYNQFNQLYTLIFIFEIVKFTF